MSLKRITIALLALGALICGCKQEEELGVPKLTIDPTELSMEKGEASGNVEILATRDWYVANKPDWAALNVEKGVASTKPQTVTISVDANKGYNRTGEIKFSIGLAKAVLTIKQNGEKGELSLGSGTKDDPYTVAGVIAYTNSLGKDEESPNSIFFKGTVTSVVTTFEGSGTYGNATFYISDPDGGDAFYCFQTYYLGNRKWKSGDKEIKVDDEVIMCGKVVNYKGNTPETVGKGGSFVYSLNGEVAGGEPVDPGKASGSGTKEDPFNVAAAINAVSGLTWTSNDNYQKVGPYYVKGVISTVDEAYAAQFGNGTFHIKDADGSAEFYVFRALYLGNKKWTASDAQIKAGDEVIIYGELMNYRGNTPETVQNSSYLYSLNGNTGGGQTQTEITSTTVADFIAKADPNTYYRLTGKVSDFSTGTNSSGKNWMQFNLKDDTGSILVYGFKDGQYDQWASKIKNGGTAVLNGTYEYYDKKSQHEVMNTTIESFTEGGGQTSDTVTGTVTEVIATADGTSVVVPEGIVAALSSQGFIVTDGTSNVYVYLKAEPAVKIGDKIKLEASKTTYYGLPELTGPTATVISSGNGVPRTELKDVTAGIDSYDASVAEYVCVTGKLVKDGNYWNVEVPGASRKATPSSLHSSINPASLEGKEVTMTGYFNTIHSGKNLLQVVVTDIAEADPNAKHCNVSTNEIKVKAEDTGASFTISANADWTVSSDNQDVAVSPASGSADATVNLSFPANTSDAPRTANIKVVCAEAGVEAVIRFTQAKASSGEAVTLSVDFTKMMESLPQKKENALKDGTFDFEGYTFILHAADAYYQAESSGSFYLLIGKTNSYIQFPAIDGKSLVKVKFLTGANASTAVIEDIAKADGTRLNINNSSLNKATEYEWEVPGEPGAAYRIVVCNDKNAQFQNLILVYE
ncbi:MAG: hypothetical protein J5759_02885 [Bacteroidales bacterium]|nr:hypothetical protein [Bacteroidales bacterium]